jgi:hypothetical protein
VSGSRGLRLRKGTSVKGHCEDLHQTQKERIERELREREDKVRVSRAWP